MKSIKLILLNLIRAVAIPHRVWSQTQQASSPQAATGGAQSKWPSSEIPPAAPGNAAATLPVAPQSHIAKSSLEVPVTGSQQKTTSSKPTQPAPIVNNTIAGSLEK